MHLYSVNLEYAHIKDPPDLARVKQFHLARALIVIIAQGDPVLAQLHPPALGPELQVNRVAGLEHPAKGADVNGLCHRSIGMMGQTAR